MHDLVVMPSVRSRASIHNRTNACAFPHVLESVDRSPILPSIQSSGVPHDISPCPKASELSPVLGLVELLPCAQPHAMFFIADEM
jgi:hypothetical protein